MKINRRKLVAAGVFSTATLAGANLFRRARAPIRPDSSTLRLDQPSDEIRSLAASICQGESTPRAKALALYRFVRDEIAFGFTPEFNSATPEYTAAVRRGHCNPQASLLVALLAAAGIEARQHFVIIRNDILQGVFPERAMPPPEIDHSFAEVRFAKTDPWIRLDGYILDPPLYRGALARLRREGRTLGFGAHVAGEMDWDGERDCMVQFADPGMALADAGAFVDARDFYQSSAYRAPLTPFSRLLYRNFALAATNKNLDALRQSGAS